MSAEAVFFYILGVVAVGSALAMVVQRNAVYCVLLLVLCFFSLAGTFLLLHAHFIAVVHILVYAGAIMVLFLFVIMLINPGEPSFRLPRNMRIKAAGTVLAALLFLGFASALRHLPETGEVVLSDKFGYVETVGELLFTDYLLPFEMASVLLLAAIVGAVVLAKREL